MNCSSTTADVWSAPFREAVKELSDARKDIIYASQSKVDLENCADEENWVPGEQILELVPDADKIQVVLLEETSSLNDVHNKLRSARNVGLVLMGETINRKSKPSAILLVTKGTFYVIDPDYLKGIQFLKAKLEDREIAFWTTNGINEADCLYHNYNIDLTKTRAQVNCCSGIHMHLMDLLKASSKAWSYANYPICAVERSRGDILIEKYEKLVQFWLDIYGEEYYFGREQLGHLNVRPLTRTAINIIKKRCILVVPLFETLNHYSWLEVKRMSQNVYNTLTDCCDAARERIIKAIADSKVEGVVECSTYAHLNGI